MTERGTYSRWSEALHCRAAAGRIPVDGTIELTRRCPLSCIHCYNRLPLGDRAAAREELTLDEIRRVLDEIAGAGGLWLLLTGGEVFARPDALAVYDLARDRGFLVTIFTNAVLIDRRIADRLAERRPFSIEVTLYGGTRETYEKVTGIPGSFERCLAGIRLLAERRLPLKLKTVALTVNRHEIPEMEAFARGLGAGFAFDPAVNAAVDGSHGPLEYRLDPGEVLDLERGDARRRTEWRRILREAPAGDGESLYRCGGGINSFAIDARGNLRICALSRDAGFDLRRGTFREGWDGLLREVRSRKRSRDGPCGTCRLQPLCGICPAIGELESGDPEGPLDFFCLLGHGRARIAGDPG